MDTKDLTPEQRQALIEQLVADNATPAAPKKAVKAIKKVTPKKVMKIVEKANLALRSQEQCDEDEMSTEAFEEICLQYEVDSSEYNDVKKRKDAGRVTILATCGDKKTFETDLVTASWSETKKDSVDMAVVYENLEPAEMAELVQLGLMNISKPNFERWAKGKGYNPDDFIVKGTPTKRLSVKRK